jgi:hypothetical protein
VPVEHIRAYEMKLLRARPVHHADLHGESCNKDAKKDVAETTVCGRKSSGILVAVTPCLQIVAIRPMYTSESLTQVLCMVLALLALFGDLGFVLYDNACSVVRHLRKQLADRGRQGQDVNGWAALLALKWAIDRLHWGYHRACKKPGTGWFVPNISPHEHPELRGADTEAAEQVFHIANRWQTVLSNSAPVHQELFMLFFAHDHNSRHLCSDAWRKYSVSQKAGEAGQSAPAYTGDEVLCHACDLPAPAPKRKKIISACAENSETACAAASSSSSAVAGVAQEPVPVAGSAEKKADGFGCAQKDIASLNVDFVVVNEGSRTVHAVVLLRDVYSRCSWSFQGRSRAVPVANLEHTQGLYTCGTCFGARALLLR